MIRKTIFFLLLIFLLISIQNGHAVHSTKPYLILISFDGFRWDYPQRGLTPNLKMMEANGVSALSLLPVFPTKTFPNHISIITGLYPENHGILHNEFYDYFKGEKYKVGDKKSIRNARWYQGEAFWETAERQGIITASYFWPGSELTLEYRRPTYFEYYDHDRPYNERIEGVFNWLQLPEEKRPHFITMYFDATDSKGHKHGPDSPENNQAIQQLDETLGLLFSELKTLEFFNKINIIVVSDHGMTNVDTKRMVNIENSLKGMDFKLQGYGPVMTVDCSDEDRVGIFDR
jgi:ectonucleotide pyrophosphatase/phosphodiesterase family protein 5